MSKYNETGISLNLHSVKSVIIFFMYFKVEYIIKIANDDKHFILAHRNWVHIKSEKLESNTICSTYSHCFRAFFASPPQIQHHSSAHDKYLPYLKPDYCLSSSLIAE